MRTLLPTAVLLALAGTAHAAIPLLNATCPGQIEVHADAGGPIYINGAEAKLRTFSDSSYEARHGHTIITLTILPDGTPDVSYTGPGRANGVCQLTDGGAAASGGACPVDVSEADRANYPACN